MITVSQFRDLQPTRARDVLNSLLSIPHFHYLPEISDIWLLFDGEALVAWMWLTKWKDNVWAIRMIDTLVRGHNYAQRLIGEVEYQLEEGGAMRRRGGSETEGEGGRGGGGGGCNEARREGEAEEEGGRGGGGEEEEEEEEPLPPILLPCDVVPGAVHYWRRKGYMEFLGGF